MAKIGIISLGCPRNLVDSEVMLGSLKKEGHEICDGAGSGVDVFIVNTCSFVKEAREESIETILEAAHLKKEGRIKYLIVAGCLPQAFGPKLLKSLPEADSLVGTSDFFKMADIVKGLLNGKKRSEVSRTLDYLYDDESPRFLLTSRHYAYLKISEGCNNLCSYCIIPRLRGAFRSRSIESVCAEARKISRGGRLKELDIIGQDTTFFGSDQGRGNDLPKLLRRLSSLKTGVRWIRILYTHPAHYSGEFIDVVRREEKICKYLDLPIQHISDKILKAMNRHTSKRDIVELVAKLRKSIPGLVLRTSVIAGFPGETDKDFAELLDFLRQARFEKLGAFLYSREELSPADRFKRHVPHEVKVRRFDEIMKLQQAISADINQGYIGRTISVLIDEKSEGEEGVFLGRTQGDAPEVDGCVYVSGKNLKVGEFYNVRITGTMEYDLVGKATKG